MKKIVVLTLLLFSFLYSDVFHPAITNKEESSSTLRNAGMYSFFHNDEKCGISLNDFLSNKVLNQTEELKYNFQCPDIPYMIKNSKLSKEQKKLELDVYNNKKFNNGFPDIGFDIELYKVDFKTGNYMCKYTLSNAEQYLYYSSKNPACIKNYIQLNNLLFKKPVASISSLGRYSFKNIFNVYDTYKTLYKGLLKGVEFYRKDILTEMNNGTMVDLNSLNSHTDYKKTFPSVIIDLLTLNTNIVQQKKILNPDGELNINPLFLQNLSKEESKAYKDMGGLAQTIQDKYSLISKQFWGFYYYLITNLSIAISQLIKILFIGGTLFLFGSAAVFKKLNVVGTEKQEAFQFDFGKKFITIGSMYLIFTAPIAGNIAHSNNMDSEFIYGGAKNQKVADNITIVQLSMRYFWQLGNYFANYVNDYGTFAYLKYIQHSYGISMNPEKNLKTLNNNYKNIVTELYSIKNNDDFLKTYCAMSYPKTYAKYHYFPSNFNVDLFELNTNETQKERHKLFHYNGFFKVNYNLCSNLWTNNNKKALTTINDITSMNDFYNKKAKILLDKGSYQVQCFDSSMKNFIKLHNNLGWFSSITLPVLEKIFNTYQLFQRIDYQANTKKFINSNNTKIIETKVNDKSPKLQEKSSSESTSEKTSIYDNFIAPLLFSKTGVKNADFMKGKYLEKGVISILKPISKLTVYMALPGFNDMYKTVSGFFKNAISSDKKDSDSFKLFNLSGMASKILDKLPGGKGVMAILIAIISFIITVIAYNIVITFLEFMIIALTIIVKMIFYYIELLITFLMSYAIVLWSISFNSNKTKENLSNFTFHIMKLAFIPILIVLSVYAVILSDKFIDLLYNMFTYIITSTSEDTLVNYSSNVSFLSHLWGVFDLNSGSVFGSLFATAGFGGAGTILLPIIKILVDLIILIKFENWTFEIIGKRVDSGISGEMQKTFDKVSGKFGGGLV